MQKIVRRGLRTFVKRAYQLKTHLAKRYIKQDYETAKTSYMKRLAKADSRFTKPPIVVYQMGKVGSSSVVASLKQADLKYKHRIYHVHFLTPERVTYYEAKRRPFLNTPYEGDLKHIWQYNHLNQQLAVVSAPHKWKVITLVRDPVARNLSTFFENIDVVPTTSTEGQVFKSVEYDFEITLQNNQLAPLIDLFFEKCRHDAPLHFFDQEFKGNLGIDLYTTPFPVDRGYQIYEGDKADVLLIRLENLDQCFTQAMEEFLGPCNIPLISANIGSQKDYATTYQQFKEIIHLPQTYVDRMYNAQFTQHFYSSDEIEAFRTKWIAQPALEIATD